MLQSKIGVPDGTSRIVRGTCGCSRRNVLRTPSPVMLRQMGYRSASSAHISRPTRAGSVGSRAVSGVTSAGRLSWAKGRIVLVTVEDGPIIGWPRDSECRIVPADPARVLWGVRRRHLIGDLRVVLECLKSVRAALRHIDHAVILGAQENAHIAAKRWGGRSQIDDHVENRASRTADELRFLVGRRLIVQAAKGALALVHGDRALGDAGIQSVGGPFALTPDPGEEASRVLQRFRVDDEDAGQERVGEDHGYTLTSGIGTTN